MLRYTVTAVTDPVTAWDWQAPPWHERPALTVASFRPESAPHRPQTRLRLLHTPQCVCGLFRVEDRFVISRYSGVQVPVYRDSCVELFLQPPGGNGYFNFEFNATGALLAYWITDPQRVADGFRAYRPLRVADCARIRRRPSLRGPITEECAEPLCWQLGFSIPLAVLADYAGPLRPLGGQCWRANAYKCADDSSQPHWAAWSPVGALDFHRPQDFGSLYFA